MISLSEDELAQLKDYKYSCNDLSLLSKYALKPVYGELVKLFPLWVAPNMITLTGLFFVIVNFVTMLWFSPDLATDCPPWVYYSWSVGLLLYQTFDAMDGGQARRTYQSGALGEMFDHGVDALNTSLEVMLFAAAMNFGYGWSTVLCLLSSLLTFYIQTWEHYYTHTLTLGYINGPVEGILAVCGLFALTGRLGGGSFWATPMLPYFDVSAEAVGFLPSWAYQLAFREWFLALGALMLIFNILTASYGVLRVRLSEKQSVASAFYGLLPFCLAWSMISFYLFVQPAVLTEHLIPVLLFGGILNAISVGQMILCHHARKAFPYDNVLVYPLALTVLDSIGPFLSTRLNVGVDIPSVISLTIGHGAFVYGGLALASVVYGRFVTVIIHTICNYLDLWCLSIKHPYDFSLENKQK